MGKTNVYKILIEDPQAKETLGGPNRRPEGKFTDMNGGKSEGVEDWIQLTPERIQWWNFV
jgi:hypothetical protein